MLQKVIIVITENSIKSFCRDTRKHAANIINYEKLEMIPLIDKENNLIKQSTTYAKK